MAAKGVHVLQNLHLTSTNSVLRPADELSLENTNRQFWVSRPCHGKSGLPKAFASGKFDFDFRDLGWVERHP
jgi:hypothetical protein